jgi:hypothetical protein
MSTKPKRLSAAEIHAVVRLSQLEVAASIEYLHGPYAGLEKGGPALAALNKARAQALDIETQRFVDALVPVSGPDYDVVDSCLHCNKREEEHVEGHCLFDSTTYRPMTHREYLQLITDMR